MEPIQLALAIFAGGAVLALVFWRRERLALVTGQITGAAGCAAGLYGAAVTLARGETSTFRAAWPTAFGRFSLGLDPLSAFFLCCSFGVGFAMSIYGGGYMRAYLGNKHLAWTAAAFNALVASIALVFLARDGFFFLFAWELMALSSFLLIAFEHERADVRKGALLYFVFSHFGVACLFGFFAYLGAKLGTFELPRAAISLGQPASSLLFLLALGGFATKAGLVPVHIWLPEAHPVAPSHVSAMLSGVMLNCGVYGVLRTVAILGIRQEWWGWLLVALGALSAIAGALNLLAATDLKKCLAYSSVENIGIIFLSLGLFLVGSARGSTTLAVLALTGALFHALSHSAFKSLLFGGAGSVLHGAHTRALSQLGGVAARMPITAGLFLLAALTAAAIPSLAGFASEWFVYRGLFAGFEALPPAGKVSVAAALAALALTSGLAAAGLARLYGIAFGGSPRSDGAAEAHEQGFAIIVPLALLAGACAAIGLYPQPALRFVSVVCDQLLTAGNARGATAVDAWPMSAVGIGFAAACGVFALLRLALLRRRTPVAGPTWGCGYALPDPRMQYSPASFSDPIVQTFPTAFALRKSDATPAALFPTKAAHLADRTDAIVASGYQPLLTWASGRLAAIRAFHKTRVQQYLVYLFFGLVALLLYASRLGRP